MKFEFTKAVEGEVGVYDGKKASTGDTVDYEGRFAEKALANPDFRQVKPRGKPAKSSVEVVVDDNASADN